MPDLQTDPLDSIPSPHEVRRRLSRTLRDASFLRRLLKLTEQWQREAEFRRELMRGDDRRLIRREASGDA